MKQCAGGKGKKGGGESICSSVPGVAACHHICINTVSSSGSTWDEQERETKGVSGRQKTGGGGEDAGGVTRTNVCVFVCISTVNELTSFLLLRCNRDTSAEWEETQQRHRCCLLQTWAIVQSKRHSASIFEAVLHHFSGILSINLRVLIIRILREEMILYRESENHVFVNIQSRSEGKPWKSQTESSPKLILKGFWEGNYLKSLQIKPFLLWGMGSYTKTRFVEKVRGVWSISAWRKLRFFDTWWQSRLVCLQWVSSTVTQMW